MPRPSPTTEEFIERSKKIFGEDHYDYSQAVYKSHRSDIRLRCKKHDVWFEYSTNAHLSGREGCPECKHNTKGSKERFIKKALKKHKPGHYDYSKVVYKGAHTPVEIRCTIHNHTFWQSPSNHLAPKGCSKCGYEQTAKKRKKSQEEFIKQSKEIFGDKFDYSKVEYVNHVTPITLRCKKHDLEFEQKAGVHLISEFSCPKCAKESSHEKSKLTNEEFIAKSKALFGDRFDYSKTQYITAKHPVTVTCKVHGDIETAPYNHLVSKYGCSKCAEDNRDEYQQVGWGLAGFYGTYNPSHLYIMEIKKGEDKWLKVGLSVNPKERAREIERSFEGSEVEVLQVWSGPARTLFEKGELTILKSSGLERYVDEEWGWAGRTECFPYEVREDLFNKTEELLSSLENVERIL